MPAACGSGPATKMRSSRIAVRRSRQVVRANSLAAPRACRAATAFGVAERSLKRSKDCAGLAFDRRWRQAFGAEHRGDARRPCRYLVEQSGGRGASRMRRQELQEIVHRVAEGARGEGAFRAGETCVFDGRRWGICSRASERGLREADGGIEGQRQALQRGGACCFGDSQQWRRSRPLASARSRSVANGSTAVAASKWRLRRLAMRLSAGWGLRLSSAIDRSFGRAKSGALRGLACRRRRRGACVRRLRGRLQTRLSHWLSACDVLAAAGDGGEHDVRGVVLEFVELNPDAQSS